MIVVPGYTIKREIGTGGMATVHLAVQTSLEREVALKVMNPALVSDPNFSRRFLQEARTLASLSHPNIVAVYDVGVTDTQLHYFSMQHLPGGDFSRRIRDGIKEPEAARVLSGVARALGFAHARGFVHRDVSPANVLFDTAENPILTDFGIAHAVTRTSRLSNAGVSVGTSHYMSPEQARGGEVDARSDIYSLGCVAYESLVGKPPFEGEDGFAIAYAHVFEPIPRLPASLAKWQELIDKALAKDPRERFGDADAFLAALSRATDGMHGIGPKRPTGEHPVHEPIMLPPAGSGIPATAKVTGPAIDVSAVTRESAAPPRAAASPPPAQDAASRRGAMWTTIAVVLTGLAVLGYAALDRLRDRDADVARDTARTTTPTPPPAPPPTVVDTLPSAPTTLGAPTDVASDGTTAFPADDAVTADGPDADAATPLDGATDAAAPQALTPEEQERRRVANATTVVDPIGALLGNGRYHLAGQRLSTPPGQNALESFRLAQRLAEHHKGPRDAERARQGIVAVAAAYVELAEKRLRDGKEAEFVEQLKKAEEIAKSVPEGAPVLQRATARRAALRDEALAAARTAAAAWNGKDAKAAYDRALRFDPASQAALKGAKDALRIGTPGWVFTDGMKSRADAPEMIVVSVGGRRIAAARTETTVAEFGRYWTARGRSTRSGDRPKCNNRERLFGGFGKKIDFTNPGFPQEPSHPVTCVGWADAVDYAQWLSAETGRKYRLPTAAEWAALGATVVTTCKANLADASFRNVIRDSDAYGCTDGFAYTAPVRRFVASSSGVYDSAGNVREWVADVQGGKRIALGTAWHSGSDKGDALQRTPFDADATANTVGFRVVRDVDE